MALSEEAFNERLISAVWMKRLKKLLMTTVTARYALLYRLGLPNYVVVKLELNAAPEECAGRIQVALKPFNIVGYQETALSFIQAVLDEPLPEGIPE